MEHPVTESITGLDLVEQMIRVAAGEKLAFGQSDVQLNGHAIETRFYAEDPYRGFLPSIGRLSAYSQPAAVGGVRVDTGVVEGAEISMFYDPMIAKLITHAPTRLEAADMQIAALDRYFVRGISHNADFLSALMQHPRFRAGEAVTTAFIAEEYPDGFPGAAVDETKTPAIAALAAVIGAAHAHRAAAVDGRLLEEHSASELVVEIDRVQHPVCLRRSNGTTEAVVAGRTITVHPLGAIPFSGVIEADVDGRRLAVQVDRRPVGFLLTHHGRQMKVRVLTTRAAELARHMLEKIPPDMSRYLLCPMPGLVVSIAVKEGDKVEAGQQLATVEAMKMENILRAEKTGTIGRLHAKAGDSLAVDAVILEFA